MLHQVSFLIVKTMKKILFALVALLGIVACENTTIEPINDTIKLSVDNAEIYANGSQVASFSVVNDKGEVINDAIIYFADTNEALEGNTFKTKYAGEYTFYAKHGNSKSNTVKVVAKEVVEDTKVVTLSTVRSVTRALTLWVRAVTHVGCLHGTFLVHGTHTRRNGGLLPSVRRGHTPA